jgi:hypothetical protein
VKRLASNSARTNHLAKSSRNAGNYLKNAALLIPPQQHYTPPPKQPVPPPQPFSNNNYYYPVPPAPKPAPYYPPPPPRSFIEPILLQFASPFEVDASQQDVLLLDNAESDFECRKSLLPETSSIYLDIVRKMLQSRAHTTIVKIERIQNKWLWDNYESSVKAMRKKNGFHNERFLFHGPRTTHPEVIYTDEVGIDMRHANPNGKWGSAIYFAEDASCSANYGYPNSDGTFSMFLARVALGDCVELAPYPGLKKPPVKPASDQWSQIKMRYDSVKGLLDGNDVYMIYENRRVYPEFVITFY